MRAGVAPRPVVAVVLAAGKGTRMRSALPKVLHEAAGRPLLAWVLAAARQAGCERVVAVVGHGAERVRERPWAEEGEGEPRFVLQGEQLGTGHALAQAEAEVAGPATLLVLSGDVPLVTPATLEALLAAAGTGGAAMAVADLDEPGSLGRVLAGPDGNLARIVEARDASPEERAVRTVNAGLYALPAPEIFGHLRGLEPSNAQGELYLTDAVGALAAAGTPVRLVPLADPDEALGVNSRQELALVHRRLVERKLQDLMTSGVTVLEPHRTRVDAGVRVGPDTVIHPDVTLLGRTAIGGGCVLHQGAWLRDATLGDGAVVEPYSVLDGAEVGPGCRVGPFARLRPGARLAEGARVGNFVEVKNSRLGRGAKANHLAYLGDAEVGEGANIGAGAVTCNYDGVSKHPTEIGAGAFVGSDTMLVAPVKIGEGAVTAAGSVITRDVPPGALAVGRARQKVVEGWARRRGRRPAPKPDAPKT
jgi:bifunctional UDP-N-acetylglucosamine pyrophosphorylase/glucosamine-1-phosphate N-acetyltransferase